MGRQISLITGILSVLLAGCSSIQGLYVASYESPIGLIKEQLLIKEDHSFVYNPPPLGVGEGGIYESTEGIWKRKGNFLVLNSDFQDTAKYYIQESLDTALSNDSILIKVFDMVTKEPIEWFGVILILDENTLTFTYYPTNQNGELAISKNVSFDKLAFPGISSRYSLTNEKSNLLILDVRQYIYYDFINESFKIRKDKLIRPINNRYRIEYRKVKQ